MITDADIRIVFAHTEFVTTEEEALELGRTTPEVVEITMQKELRDEARLDQAFARSTRRHAMLEDWIDSVNEPLGSPRARLPIPRD